MSWHIDEHVLEQLRNLWQLAPPGTTRPKPHPTVGGAQADRVFFLRMNNSTRALPEDGVAAYRSDRWADHLS